MNFARYIAISILTLAPAFAAAGDFARILMTGNPEPGTSVQVSIASSYIDPREASVVWYVGGSFIAKTTGEKRQSIQIGELGSKTTVTAIVTYRGAEYKEVLDITPAVSDVVWEARTATPPFYRGKAMPSHDSIVRVMAATRFTSDGENEPTFADYTWSKNGSAQLSRGIGADSAQFIAGWPGRAMTASVNIVGSGVKTSASANITSRNPKVLIYEVSPLLGILTHNAFIGQVDRSDMKIDVISVPFGVSLSDLDNDRIQYSWSLGGSNVSTGATHDDARLTLSRESDPSKTGVVEISSEVQSLTNAMQYGKGGFRWNLIK